MAASIPQRRLQQPGLPGPLARPEAGGLPTRTLGPMSDFPPPPKAVLHRYLRLQRDQLLAKLDGLDERAMRWPMTPTGTNLLGLVKHVAGVQLGYFTEVFGQPLQRNLPWMEEGAELNADMWATADETREEIVDLYRFSCDRADETIETLDLDSRGRVAWWPPERQEVTLHLILVHVGIEVARHAGHADILRELIDGRAGNNDRNLPELTPEEWRAYCSRLEWAAERAAELG